MKAFITMRDLLTWPALLAQRLAVDGHEVVLVDNASTYPPLLVWYENCPYRVVRLTKNLGHLAPWLTLRAEMADAPYIVTDPDVSLDDVPPDWAERALALMTPEVTKVGLPISTRDIPLVGLGQSGKWYEAARTLIDQWVAAAEVFRGPVVPIPVDTTLAVYAAARGNAMDGVCLSFDYAVHHMPWYLVGPNNVVWGEYEYYVEHARGFSTMAEHLKGESRVE